MRLYIFYGTDNGLQLKEIINDESYTEAIQILSDNIKSSDFRFKIECWLDNKVIRSIDFLKNKNFPYLNLSISPEADNHDQILEKFISFEEEINFVNGNSMTETGYLPLHLSDRDYIELMLGNFLDGYPVINSDRLRKNLFFFISGFTIDGGYETIKKKTSEFREIRVTDPRTADALMQMMFSLAKAELSRVDNFKEQMNSNAKMTDALYDYPITIELLKIMTEEKLPEEIIFQVVPLVQKCLSDCLSERFTLSNRIRESFTKIIIELLSQKIVLLETHEFPEEESIRKTQLELFRYYLVDCLNNVFLKKEESLDVNFKMIWLKLLGIEDITFDTLSQIPAKLSEQYESQAGTFYSTITNMFKITFSIVREQDKRLRKEQEDKLLKQEQELIALRQQVADFQGSAQSQRTLRFSAEDHSESEETFSTKKKNQLA